MDSFHVLSIKNPEVKWKWVTQLCLTLCGPMDCIVHGDFSGQNTGVGSLSLLQRIFPTQGSNPGLPLCRQILYHLSHQGSKRDQNLWYPLHKFLCLTITKSILYAGIVIFTMLQRSFPTWKLSSFTSNLLGKRCISQGKKKKKQEKCKGSYWTRIWLLWSWYALEEVSKWQDVKGSSLPVDRSKARNFKFQQNVLKLFHLFALWSRYLKATQGIIEQASQHESLYFINYTDIVLFFLYLSHK